MEIREVLVFTIFLVVLPFSKCDVNYACCPPTSYIFNNTCLDVYAKNVSALNIGVCDSMKTFVNKNFTINSDKLVVKYHPLLPPIILGPLKACYGNEIKNISNLQNASRVLKMCSERQEDNKFKNVFVYCSMVSVVFLALVVIIYSSIEEIRDLFGWSVINFCTSLALGLATYAYLRMVTSKSMGSCAAQGFLAYFFLMASFFWINSISIQVLRDTRRPPVVGHGWSELKYYLLYSWGTPALLTIIMAIVNFHPGDHNKPGIGLNHCWFIDGKQQWYYMFSVMAILFLINLAIFIYIATIIGRLSFSAAPIMAVKFKMWLTVKLIILLGLPWILIMISSTTGAGSIIGLIIDITVGLQGLLLFLVLVMRLRVVKVLYRRGLLCGCSGLVERWLAREDDAETQDMQHTNIPMHEDHLIRGNVNQ